MAAGRLDIINVIATALAGIDQADGYNTTVAKVEKKLRDWNDVETYPRPWVGFRPTQETYQYEPSHRLRCSMGLQLVAHLDVLPVDGADYEAIEKISDDIIRALRQSVLRSGCAESITLTQTDTTEGDPSGDESASLSMVFDVKYYRTEPMN